MKYLIKASIEVEGLVDKHDIIGAIFGQTEGLLGGDFDLRELQDKGRIGRIQVEVHSQGNKTIGEIQIPSNLGRVETALIAALIEGVERVGPYPAKIRVTEIIDVRLERIQKVIERAKEILKEWSREKTLDYKEVVREVAEAVKAPEITEYGPERLPAGPGIDRSDTVIIVEGRADVINMLRYGYDNVIAIEGARGTIPKTIVELAKRKRAIAFVDGDHGGELILKELLRVADIDYVARAPEGKEVEDLTGKEIARALNNKVPAKEYLKILEKPRERKEEKQVKPKVTMETIEVPEHIVNIIPSINGTLEALLYDKDWKTIARIPVRELVDKLSNIDEGKVYAVVFDGIITQRLVDIAATKKVKLLIGAKIGGLARKPENIHILVFEDLAPPS